MMIMLLRVDFMLLCILTAMQLSQSYAITEGIVVYDIPSVLGTFTQFECDEFITCTFLKDSFEFYNAEGGSIQTNPNDDTIVRFESAPETGFGVLNLGSCTGTTATSRTDGCYVTCSNTCSCEYYNELEIPQNCPLADNGGQNRPTTEFPGPTFTPTSLPVPVEPTPTLPPTSPPFPVPSIPQQLTERFEKNYDVPTKDIRTVVIYYTTNSANDADNVNSQADAEMVADWIGSAWIQLRDFNDPLDGQTQFVLALYEVPSITTCCPNDLLSLNAGIVLSYPELARERAVYEFWKSINYSETHGRWVNEGFAIYGTYRALMNEISRTTLGYQEALDFFFAGEYQRSLIEQEATAAIFWKYVEEQSLSGPSASLDTDSISVVWSNGLTGQNVFDLVDRRIRPSFETLFANFGAACYADSLNIIDSKRVDTLSFVDSDRLEEFNSGYPELVPNYDYSFTEINAGISITVEMPSWSNFYFRFTVKDSDDLSEIIGDGTGSFQISVIQDVSFPVIYTLMLINNGDLVGYIRVDDEMNFVRTIFNEDFSEIVLVVTSLGEALGFSLAASSTNPTLMIDSPRSLTAVGSPASPGLFNLRFRVTDPDGEKEVVNLDSGNVIVSIGTVDVPSENILSFEYLSGGYVLMIRAPEQEASISGTTVDVSVAIGSLTDTKIDVILYDEAPNTDTIIAIDSSGSMLQNGKLTAAQIASSVLIDSYSETDRVAIVTFGAEATLDVSLAEIASNRENLLQAINDIVPSGGQALIGSALLTCLSELDARGEFSRLSSIVLISDGQSPASDTGIDKFLTQWDTRGSLQCNSSSKAGCRPVVHTVNLGERQVDRPDLERISEQTGGVYHFVEVPNGTRRKLDKFNLQRKLTTTEEQLTLELADILRTINEDIVDTDRLVSETGLLPCLDTGGGNVVTTFTIDGSISRASVFFVWTGESLVPGIQLLRPDGLDFGQPDVIAGNYYVWDIDGVVTGSWTLNISASSDYCTSANAFLVEVATASAIFFKTGLSFGGELPEVGEPIEVFATLGTNQPLRFQNVQAAIISPDGTTSSLTLEDSFNGVYANIVFAKQAGNYDVTVTASGSEVTVGYGNYDRSDSSSFGVPIPADTDGDGIPDALERRFKCLDITADDADDDADADGVSNVDEVSLNLDPCNSNSDNGGEADGSEIAAGRDPSDPVDDVVTCTQDLDADNRAFDRDGTGICESAQVAVLRYSPDGNYARINVWRAEIAQGVSSRTLRTRDFTLLNDVRDASIFTDVDGEFVDTDIELGKRYCYRFQGVTATGKRSCIKGTLRPACTTPLQRSLCVFSFQINRGSCCTFEKQVLLSVDASGAQRMKVSNLPSFEDVEWEPYVPDRPWSLNDTITGRPQTVYTTLEGNDGSTSSRSASITFTEAPPSLSPTEAPFENGYQCRQLFINGETLHINFGLFCVSLCLPFPDVFRFLGWGRGECPSCGYFCI